MMRKRLFQGAVLALLSVFLALPVLFQQKASAQGVPPAGQSRLSNEYVASNFGRWNLRAQSGSTGTGSYSLTFPAGGYTVNTAAGSFTPFTTTTRLLVGQGTNQETVTPTTVSGCGISSTGTCTVTATFTNAHGAGTVVRSGSYGLDEALNVANANGGGVVLVDGTSGITDALIQASTATFPAVTIESMFGSTNNTNPLYYTIRPTILTAVATPATRVAAATCPTPIIATTVCDSPTAAVGTWTNADTFVCVFYVDAMGQKSPCSATADYTTAGSLAIFFSSPAASAGAVGWGVAAGITGYTTAYQLPITSTNCVLNTVEKITPACAIGASGSFPTPATTTALHPGYVVATYNPNDITHTTYAYMPSHALPLCGGLLADWTPAIATVGGTTTQKQVLGSVEIPNGCLNQIGKTLRVSGKIAMTNGTSETPQFLIQLGPSWTTGTPKNICTLTDTTALTAAANSTYFVCTMTVNAIGTTGTVQPGGFALTQLQAGTTAGAAAVESATTAVTSENLVGIAGTSQTLFITYIGTSGTSTAAQLMDLHLEMP